MRVLKEFTGKNLSLPNNPTPGISKCVVCPTCGGTHFSGAVVIKNVETGRKTLMTNCDGCGKEESFTKPDKFTIEE